LILQSKILEKSRDLSVVVQLDEVRIPESLDSEVKLVNDQIISLNKDRANQATAKAQISSEAWRAFLRDNIATAVASYKGKTENPNRALASIRDVRLPATKLELKQLRGELERCKAKLNSTRPVMNEVN